MMRDMLAKRLYTPMTTEQFQIDLEAFSGLDLNQKFQTYIYGNKLNQSSSKSVGSEIHKKILPFQLYRFL
jgi:hypothetical protein